VSPAEIDPKIGMAFLETGREVMLRERNIEACTY